MQMARDFYHEIFRKALQKDGWTITDYPLTVRVGRIGFEIDFGAEKLIAAVKGHEKIAVELKSFVGASNVNEFHKAVGQFNDYYVALEIKEPDRVLYLAVPDEIWKDFFQEIVIQKALRRIGAKIIVFSPSSEKIIEWIK